VRVSRETLRGWMRRAGIWLPRAERKRIQQPRHRREHVGELIQIDGSEHRWFEDRAPSCTLLVFIDDATSRLMELRFVPSESTFAYFETLKSYLEHHGRLVAFYSDKHSEATPRIRSRIDRWLRRTGNLALAAVTFVFARDVRAEKARRRPLARPIASLCRDDRDHLRGPHPASAARDGGRGRRCARAIGIPFAQREKPFQEPHSDVRVAEIRDSAASSLGTTVSSAATSSALKASNPFRYGSAAASASLAFSVRCSVSIMTSLPVRITFTIVSTTSMKTCHFSSGVASTTCKPISLMKYEQAPITFVSRRLYLFSQYTQPPFRDVATQLPYRATTIRLRYA
jgi:hypothetical protein